MVPEWIKLIIHRHFVLSDDLRQALCFHWGQHGEEYAGSVGVQVDVSIHARV